mgnify:CR=1 FL=1
MNSEGCICIDVRTAAQRLTAIYDQAMAASGVSVNQFSLLHLIFSLDTPTLKDLAVASGLDRSTLGRNIRVMEKLGFVTMHIGDDARVRNVRMTSKGSAAFKKAVPMWREVQSRLANKIGPAQHVQFKETLQTLTSSAMTA